MDTKLQTFLALCKNMNYRITAEQLHLTQPAVTKQIQALEQQYGIKLFIYDGRKLYKTESCNILEEYCKSLQYNYNELTIALKNNSKKLLRIGATKTIGDYILNPYVIRYLKEKNNGISLIIDNTEALLKKLDNAELDFAVIEGFFSKQKYNYQLLRSEPFTGICHKNHRLAGKTATIEELLCENLIVRESGSGTRDILEHELYGLGYRITDFSKVLYISSFKLIIELINKQMGISFAYKSVVDGEDDISFFQIEQFKGCHDLNIVSLKNTFSSKYISDFFKI